MAYIMMTQMYVVGKETVKAPIRAYAPRAGRVTTAKGGCAMAYIVITQMYVVGKETVLRKIRVVAMRDSMVRIANSLRRPLAARPCR